MPTRSDCNPKLTYNYAANGQSITGVTVTANGNTCAAPIAVTFPGTASTSSGGTTNDKVGSEPLIVNVQLSGSPVTFTLGAAVPI